MAYPEAITAGAIAIFEEKYGERVRVISFGPYSTELCGGTHARATGDIGLLKILSDSGIASGVRRIEATTGQGALALLRAQERTLEKVAAALRTSVAELPERAEKLMSERREAERENEKLRAAKRGAASGDLSAAAKQVGGVNVIAARVDGVDAKDLRAFVDQLRQKLGSAVVLLATEQEGRVSLALGITPDLVGRFRAGDLVRELAAIIGGKGGGRPDFAQAGGNDPSQLAAAFERLDALIAGG